MWLSPCLRQGLATDPADKDVCSALGSRAGGSGSSGRVLGLLLSKTESHSVSNPIWSHQRVFSSVPPNNDGITHMGKVKHILLPSKIYLDRSHSIYSMQFSSEVFSADTGTLT